MSQDEVEAIAIDQIYVATSESDEFGARHYAVYLQDADTGKSIACAGYDDGTKVVREEGILYGRLSVPFKLLADLASYQGMQFQVSIVEKDGEDCPAQISEDDDLIGTTAPVDFDGLLGHRLTTTNGSAAILLRPLANEPAGVPLMVATTRPGLGLEAIRLDLSVDTTGQPDFALRLVGVDGDGFGCQISGDAMPAIPEGGGFIGGLNGFFACVDKLDQPMLARRVQLELWRQAGDAIDLISQTDETSIGALVGQEVALQGNWGSLRFRDLNGAPFSRSKVGQEELAHLVVAATTVGASADIREWHLVEPTLHYSVACSADGTLFGAVTGQEDLFGWAGLAVALVERDGDDRCPGPLEDADRIIGASVALTPSQLAGGTYAVVKGDGEALGTVTLEVK